MLETLGQTNIGSLNLEEPKVQPRLEFDLGIDFTDNEMVSIRDKWNTSANSQAYSSFAQRCIKILFPDFTKSLEQQSLDLQTANFNFYKYEQDIKGEINPSSFLDRAIDDYMELLTDLMIIYPDGIKAIRSQAGREAFNMVLETEREVFGPQVRLSTLLATRLLLPEEAKKLTPKPFNPWARTEIVNSLRDKSLIRLASAEETRLDSDYMEKAFAALQEYRDQKNSLYTIFIASYIKILTAPSIEFTDEGLKLMSQPALNLVEEIPSLPEMRKF
ncbi:MAG: hypothetical protein Q7R49_01800 [Candidatus Daviesbacteria bacterium]|nr:hypothetical protein [Candidatus Daviesbacteria bacterium]